MQELWTAERLCRAKAMWAERKSGETIATELGGGLTRNAVIGKMHREGLSRFTFKTKPSATRVPLAPKPARVRPPRPTPPPRPMRPPPPKPIAYVERPGISPTPIYAPPDPETAGKLSPSGQRCAIMDLDGSRCRWPHGLPGSADFFFCGGAPVDDRPYCAYHSRIAYEAPKATGRRFQFSP